MIYSVVLKLIRSWRLAQPVQRGAPLRMSAGEASATHSLSPVTIQDRFLLKEYQLALPISVFRNLLERENVFPSFS